MPRMQAAPVSFLQTSIGKKAVVAVTGIILYAYVLAHLAGNLLIYCGRSTLNGYARLLQPVPACCGLRA